MTRSAALLLMILPVLTFGARAAGPGGFHSAISRTDDAEKWVVIELAKSARIEAVALTAIADAQLFPVRFRIDVSESNQFRNFTTVVDKTREDQIQAAGGGRFAFAPTQGRYVRLVVTKLPKEPGGRFAFGLAKIRVEENAVDVAANAPVRVSDALDSEAWSAAALTQGTGSARGPTTAPVETSAVLLDPRLLLNGEFECSNAEINRIMRLASAGQPPWHHAGELGIEQCIAPWLLYQRTGDRQIAARFLPGAMRHVDALRKRYPDLICKSAADMNYEGAMPDGLITQPAPLPDALVAIAHFAHCARVTSYMANVTGQTEGERNYAALADEVAAAFNREFVKPDASLVPQVPGAYALALQFELLPANLRPGAADRLAELIHKQRNHLATGRLCTGAAMLSLSRYGFHDVALEAATERTAPTLAGHPAVGEVRDWVWHCIAGIEPDAGAAGPSRLIIRPRPAAAIRWANSRLDTPRGAVEVRWNAAGNQFSVDIVLPKGSTGEVHVPAKDRESITVFGGRFVRMRDSAAVFEVESGRHRFESRQ